ncbi:methionine--tRNA ligase [Buchnera aphidicola]|uniref:methionine--tRNA ligase n=1 Tax=Buchnera aphidicola TaxID=9 RepID=UPI00346450CC
MKKKILVTCALPYSNGDLHIGHMLEHIQADIWVRYYKMRKREVWFVCSDDTHGTAIMLKARELNVSPKLLILNTFKEHVFDFQSFNINYDYYSSTHHIQNFYWTKKLYYRLKLRNLLQIKNIDQLYDTDKDIFLPDRFVKGTCPVCYSKNQYGDHCESCGSIYKASMLISPISNISNTIPIIKNSKHIFLDLSILQKKLYQWIISGVVNKNVVNKIKEWFLKDLHSWNISRDYPYFGFKIPDFYDKYFYVWLDAPMSYISTFKCLCNYNSLLNFDEFWKKNSHTELYHFIGKDITYFHVLFWPLMLEVLGFRKPTKIFVHGHLTFQGKKISKSKNSFITAKKWLKYFDSDSLRYYYASKLSSKIEDIEMNLKDFENKINSDIVNKVVNLASRSSSFLSKYFNNILSKKIQNMHLYQQFTDASFEIGRLFENREFSLVIKKIIFLTDIANQYFNEQKPWKLLLTTHKTLLHEICTMGINLFRIIMTFLKPIIPDLAKRSESFLLIHLSWNNIDTPLLNHRISIFRVLYHRIKVSDLNNDLNH